MTPSDTLRAALRACIADRTESGYRLNKALDPGGADDRWRALLAAFAEWEKAPAPASSRLREAAQAIISYWTAPCPMIGPTLKKQIAELRDESLRARIRALEGVIEAASQHDNTIDGKAVGWSSPQRTAELQARIDSLLLGQAERRGLFQRIDLAEARVKELEGELRALHALIEEWHNGYGETGKANYWPRPKTHVIALKELFDEEAGAFNAKSLTVAEFADAVAKLAKAVKP